MLKPEAPSALWVDGIAATVGGDSVPSQLYRIATCQNTVSGINFRQTENSAFNALNAIISLGKAVSVTVAVINTAFPY